MKKIRKLQLYKQFSNSGKIKDFLNLFWKYLLHYKWWIYWENVINVPTYFLGKQDQCCKTSTTFSNYDNMLAGSVVLRLDDIKAFQCHITEIWRTILKSAWK